MNYDMNTMYRLTDKARKEWLSNCRDTVNKRVARTIGTNSWSPLELDRLGRVTKLELKSGGVISIDTLNAQGGVDCNCMFDRGDLDENKVIAVGPKEDKEDRYIIIEHTQYSIPTMAVKDGKNIFTLEEAKEIMLELADLTAGTNASHEIFKTVGVASVKTVRTVEIK